MGFFSSLTKVADPLGIVRGVTGQTAAEAATKAAKTQAQSATDAIAEQRRQFDLSLEMTAPWREAGVNALGQYQNALANPTESFNAFTQTPAYTFPLQQGTQAVERSAAARGGLLSGRTGKELTRFGQNYASGQYQNYLSNLAGLAGIGQQTSTQAGQNALFTGSNVGNLLTQQGNARASGYLGVAGAKGAGVENILKIAAMIAAAG